MLGSACSPCCGSCSLPAAPSSVQIKLSGGLEDPAYAAASGNFDLGVFGKYATVAVWCKCSGTYELSHLRRWQGLPGYSFPVEDYFYADDNIAMLFRLSVEGNRNDGSSIYTNLYAGGDKLFWNWSLQINAVRWREIWGMGYLRWYPGLSAGPRTVFSKQFITGSNWQSVGDGINTSSNAIPSNLHDALLSRPTYSVFDPSQEYFVGDQAGMMQACGGTNYGAYRNPFTVFGEGLVSHLAQANFDYAGGVDQWIPNLSIDTAPYIVWDTVGCDVFSQKRFRYTINLVDLPRQYFGNPLILDPPAAQTTFPSGVDSTTAPTHVVQGFPATIVVNVDEIKLNMTESDYVSLPYSCQ